MRAPCLSDHPDLSAALAEIVRPRARTTDHLSWVEWAQTIAYLAGTAAFCLGAMLLGPVMVYAWGSIS